MKRQGLSFRARFLIGNAATAAALLLFLFLDRYAVFDLFLICPLHTVGLYCPTCGMTRAAHALLAGRLTAALTYHPGILLLLLLALYYEGYGLVAAIRNRGAILSRAGRWPLYLTATLLLAFFVLRNLLLALGIDPVGDFLP